MKKKLLLLMSAILTVALLMCVLAACNEQGGGESPRNISRSVDALYVGENGDFAVTLESGVRETPFIADGKVGEVVAFSELTVTPMNVNDYTEIEYVISSADGGATLAGKLTTGRFGEFRCDAATEFLPAAITLTAGGQTAEIELKNVMEGKLTAEDAVNVAEKQFAERIAAEEAEGKPGREIYLKLVTGDRESYYYYVSFIGEGTDYWAALIDPSDGRVVSER